MMTKRGVFYPVWSYPLLILQILLDVGSVCSCISKMEFTKMTKAVFCSFLLNNISANSCNMLEESQQLVLSFAPIVGQTYRRNTYLL